MAALPSGDWPAAAIGQAFIAHLAAASAETFAALGDGEDVRL